MSEVTEVLKQALEAMERGEEFDLAIDCGEGKLITIPKSWYTKEELEELIKEEQ